MRPIFEREDYHIRGEVGGLTRRKLIYSPVSFAKVGKANAEEEKKIVEEGGTEQNTLRQLGLLG